MKLLHAGLLVVGAALAGAVAVRMSEPPPLTVLPETPAPEGVAPPTPASAAPTVVHAAPPSVSQAPPEIVSPPPVYAEPPHVAKPSPAPKPRVWIPPVKPPSSTPSSSIVESTPPSRPAPYEEPSPVPTPAPPPSRSATLRPGSDLAVRLLQTLSPDRVQPGDVFQGVIAEPVVADGFVIAERGAPVTGRVVQVQNGSITLRLLNIETADGQRLEVSTEPWSIRLVSGQSVVRFRLAARITVTERKP